VPKIRALRAEIERRGLDIDIQVDGGINAETVSTVVSAGANVLVAGYGVYRAPNGDYAGARAAP
jgi:ribulose-phosphate 3-epimerase